MPIEQMIFATSENVLARRATTVPIRRNLTGNAFPNGNGTERIQNGYKNANGMGTERVQNGFRTDTERLSNGNETDTERLRITKIEESVLKNANYKRTRSSEHTLRLRYQSAYRGFGNDVTLNTSSSNFHPARQS